VLPEDLFTLFGTPRVHKSDNGSPYQSHNFAEFAKRLGFQHRSITPLWPRANAESLYY
jgi:transposase InsO family protein